MKLKVALGVILLTLTPMAVFCQTADADTKAAIEKLQAQIDTLKSQVGDPEGGIQTNIADVSKLKKVTFSGYAQLRADWKQDATNSVTGGDQRINFSQRRVRLKVTGTPTDSTSVVFQSDMGDKGFVMKDAYIDYKPTGDPITGVTATIGQFAIPFGYQNAASSSSMDTPERSQIVRDLFPDEYDRGIKLSSKTAGMVRWDVALLSGAGMNNADTSQNKDIVGRLRLKPTQSLDCGVSYYKGGRQYVGSTAAVVGPPAVPAAAVNIKNRENTGVDFQYYTENMSFKGEIISGDKITVGSAGAPGKAQRESGYYLTSTYNVTPKNMAVCMYESYHIAGDTAGNRKIVTLGVNHYLDTNTKLRFFYIWKVEQKTQSNNNNAFVEVLSTF
ncbi:MAG: porin [bacterium]